jgi:CHAD domain-containing protein
MVFQFRCDESVKKGVRRLLQKQIKNSLQLLIASDTSQEESVHEVRKNFKKIRSILRLIRPEIGTRVYREQNRCFRNAGRPLSQVRDAQIFVQALDSLSTRKFRSTHALLKSDLEALKQKILKEENMLDAIAKSLSSAWKELASWCRLSNKWKSFGQGLKQTYRKARQAYQAAKADPATPKLHEWRKQMKYLRYQLELLAPVNEQALERRIKLAHRLGDVLGDDHDLSALRIRVADHVNGNEKGPNEFFELLDKRRAKLIEQARRLGRRFFRDPESAAMAEIRDDWKAWRHCQASA